MAERATTVFGDCDAIDALLSPFADGELFGADRDLVARHLEGCSRCCGIVDDYRALGRALREAAGRAPSPDLSAITWPPRSTRGIEEASSALTPRRRLFYDLARRINPWPVLAAAAMIALVIGIGLWRPTDRDTRVEIERLDAAGPVMVLTGNGGRTAIIWILEAEEPSAPEPTPI